MTTTAQQAIDEVLRLAENKIQGNALVLFPEEAERFSVYRTSCPKLAKALAVALEALKEYGASETDKSYGHYNDADRFLSQIEDIFQEQK